MNNNYNHCSFCQGMQQYIVWKLDFIEHTVERNKNLLVNNE